MPRRYHGLRPLPLPLPLTLPLPRRLRPGAWGKTRARGSEETPSHEHADAPERVELRREVGAGEDVRGPAGLVRSALALVEGEPDADLR